MKAIKFLCPLQSNQVKRTPQEYINEFIIQKLNPLLVVLPREIARANCRMKRFHWQLFALSTLSFSVPIENFGFTVSTMFFSLKKCFSKL